MREPQSVEICSRTSVIAGWPADDVPGKATFMPSDVQDAAERLQVRLQVFTFEQATMPNPKVPTVDVLIADEDLEYAVAWCRARREFLSREGATA